MAPALHSAVGSAVPLPSATVNFVSPSATVRQRISYWAHRVAGFRLLSTAGPLPPSRVSLYVVPLPLFSRVHGVTSIVYGPPAQLVHAFLAGCADFLREPWTPAEMELRALRLLSITPQPATLEASWDGATLTGPEGAVRLSLPQWLLLRALLGRPVPRSVLEYAAWDRTLPSDSRALDAQIAALRSGLKQAVGRRATLVAVRGHGYRLEGPAAT